jgi:hypothetical protein
MDYADLVLQLTPGPGDAYGARITTSPAGEAEGKFKPPPGAQETAASNVQELARAASPQASGGDRDVRARRVAQPPLRALGDQLFRAAFAGPLGSRFDESLGLLASEPERGLRLRLQMNPGEPALARLEALPWEYLYRSEQGAFLGLSTRIAIVRSPSLPLAGRRPPAARPRVLALVCDPPGLPPLDLARESKVLAGLEHDGRAAIRFLHRPTLDQLRGALREQRPHVLHVMGHGAFAPGSGEGSLYLARAEGGWERVEGALLADQLRDCPSLLLVFLNACQTARSIAPNPFAGVAAALLRAGVPAVVAMQAAISDRAAIAFSAEFYRQLARGEAVETATGEGRLAVRRHLPASLEWGTPVLFLRAGSDRLWGEEPGPARVSPTRPAAAQGPRRQRAARLAWGMAATVLVIAGVGRLMGIGGILPGRPAPSQPEQGRPPAAATGPAASGPKATRQVPTGAEEARETTAGTAETSAETSKAASGTVASGTAANGRSGIRPAERSTVPPVRDAASPSASRPHRQAERSPGGGSDAPRAGSAARGGGPYRVSALAPVYLPEVRAELSAQFLDVAGEKEFRLFLSPDAGSSDGSRPLLGPESVTFKTPLGTVRIDVLAVDWEHATVLVRPHLEASRPTRG